MQQNNADDELITMEEQARNHTGNSTNSTALAQAYAARGQWQEAIEAYRSALTLDGDNADLYAALGTAYKHVGDLKPAEEAYRKAITLQPDHTTAYLNLGMLFEKQTRIPEAIGALKKCLELSSDPDESSAARKNLQALLRKYPETDKPEPRAALMPNPSAFLDAAVKKETRSWGYWSLGLGAVHIFASGFLSAPWGLVLLLVGAGSFVFQEIPMLVIYGITLGWVGLMNALTGKVEGIGFGIFQAYLGYKIFRQFLALRKIAANIPDVDLSPKTNRVFPYLGCLLGLVTCGGVVGIIGGVFIASALGVQEFPDFVDFLFNMLPDLAAVGFAVALATLFSKHKRKIFSIPALISCTLVMILQIYFLVSG